MNKKRIKDMAIGFILCLMLSAGVMVTANTQTVTREITYGVRVNLNGQLMQFEHDMRPFVMGSRTYLSVRAISDALDLPVDFDPNTNTVYLGNRHLGRRTPLSIAVPAHDWGSISRPGATGNNWGFQSRDSVSMAGRTYDNALTYEKGGTRRQIFSLHNLDGQYRMLTGYIGRVDGTRIQDVTVNFVGDGQLIQTFTLRADALPHEFSTFVEGVRLLRIEFEFGADRGPTGPMNTMWALVAYLD